MGIPMGSDSDSEDSVKSDGFPKLRMLMDVFLIDFFGGMVPGILFILAGSFALGFPIHALLVAVSSSKQGSVLNVFDRATSAVKQTPSALWLGAFVIFALIAFVVGQLFYRNDPKTPDRRSFKKLAKERDTETC
ncbi:MAG TPA: hypothetical protein VMB21_07905, partial [Candidatus Limnocylindria bacterium]|nr:hypothetical protein [Candidatus Limnocylindria bacterium]